MYWAKQCDFALSPNLTGIYFQVGTFHMQTIVYVLDDPVCPMLIY